MSAASHPGGPKPTSPFAAAKSLAKPVASFEPPPPPIAESDLHRHAFLGHEKKVGELLLAGADANGVDSAGLTPLMLAAAAGEAGVVRVLLNGGADPTRRANSGSDAVGIALKQSRRDPAVSAGIDEAIALVREAQNQKLAPRPASNPWAMQR